MCWSESEKAKDAILRDLSRLQVEKDRRGRPSNHVPIQNLQYDLFLIPCWVFFSCSLSSTRCFSLYFIFSAAFPLLCFCAIEGVKLKSSKVWSSDSSQQKDITFWCSGFFIPPPPLFLPVYVLGIHCKSWRPCYFYFPIINNIVVVAAFWLC